MPYLLNFFKCHKNLLSGFSYLATSSMVGILFGLASAYVFANFVDKALFGQYQYILTLVGILSLFSLRGVQYSIIKDIVGGTENALNEHVIRYIKFALIPSTFALLIASYYFYKGDIKLGYVVTLVGVCFPLFKAMPLYDAVFVANKDFRRKAIFDSVYSAVPAAIIIMFALWVNTQLIHYVGVYFIANILVSASLLFIAQKIYKNTTTGNNFTLQNNKFDFHHSVNISIFDLEKIAHQFIIFNLLGATSLAIYTIANLPVKELKRIQQILRTLTLSHSARDGQIKRKRMLLSKTFTLFVIFSGISATYTLIAPYLFSIVFPEYEESILLTQILVWMIPFSASFPMYQTMLFSAPVKKLYFINIINLFFRLGSVILATIYFGLTGVMFALVVSNAFRFATILTFFLRIPERLIKNNQNLDEAP